MESKNCNWLWNGWSEIPTNINEFNRYDAAYGLPFRDVGVDKKHPGPIHNNEYANVLLKHIYKNFRNYLPDNIEPIKTTLI